VIASAKLISEFLLRVSCEVDFTTEPPLYPAQRGMQIGRRNVPYQQKIARPRELYDHQRFELRVPLIPWPAWAAFGGSVDMTINAPSQVLYNPTAGLGKNLSVGYFYGPDGPQGISLSLGPSVGPPLNVSLPTPNTCTRLAN